MILSVARKILRKELFGRTNKWVFKKLEWLDYNKLYKFCVQRYIHKMLNNENEHYIKHNLIKNPGLIFTQETFIDNF